MFKFFEKSFIAGSIFVTTGGVTVDNNLKGLEDLLFFLRVKTAMKNFLFSKASFLCSREFTLRHSGFLFRNIGTRALYLEVYAKSLIGEHEHIHHF